MRLIGFRYCLMPQGLSQILNLVLEKDRYIGLTNPIQLLFSKLRKSMSSITNTIQIQIHVRQVQ